MGASTPLAWCELLRETGWFHTGHKDTYVSRMTKKNQNYISFYIFYIETNWNGKDLSRPRDKEINFSKLQSVLFSLYQVEVFLKTNEVKRV